jgi:hypothetical protein
LVNQSFVNITTIVRAHLEILLPERMAPNAYPATTTDCKGRGL